MGEQQHRRQYQGAERVDMLERIEADPAAVVGGVVAEGMRDEPVCGLMEGDGDDERQYPDRQVVEGDVHRRPDRFDGWASLPSIHERSALTGGFADQEGIVPGYCGRPSSSF